MPATFDDANTIVRPYLRSQLAMAIAVTVGMGIVPPILIAFAMNDANANAIVGQYWWGIGGAWLLSLAGGIWVVAATVLERGRPCRIYSTSPNVALPREPVCAEERMSAGQLHYEWADTPEGGWLRPIPGRTRRLQLAMVVWMTCFGAVMTVVLWKFGPRDPGLFGVIENLMAVFVFPFSVVVGLVIATFAGMACSREVTCEVRRRENRCRVTRDTDDLLVPFILRQSKGLRDRYAATAPPELDLSLSDLIAVQICLYWRKVGAVESDHNGHWSLELNLAYRPSNVRLSGGATSISNEDILRENLLVTSGQFERLIPVAQSLAEALHVPLINHATPADLERENKIGPTRQPVTGGWSSH